MSERAAIRVGALSAAVFVAVAALIVAGATRGFDLATTIASQSIASSPLDLLVNADTVVGQAVTTVAIAIVFALLLRFRDTGAIWVAPLFILLTGGIEYAFKLLLYHPSPGPEFIRATGNPLGIRVVTPSAFPSGHVARVTFLSFVLALAFPGRPVRIACVAFVLLTVFARVYIGDHWISDAVGGIALGAGVGSLAAWWIARAGSRTARIEARP